MDEASYSYTEHGYNVAMDELKREREAAWAWLSKIPKHTWARHAMDTNCKTDLVVNNLSEGFNKWRRWMAKPISYRICKRSKHSASTVQAASDK